MNREIKVREGLWAFLSAHTNNTFKGEVKLGGTRWSTHLPGEFLRRAGVLHLGVPGLSAEERLEFERELQEFLAEVHSRTSAVPLAPLPVPEGVIRIPGGIRFQGGQLTFKQIEGSEVIALSSGGHTTLAHIGDLPAHLTVEERCEMLTERLGTARQPQMITWMILAHLIGKGQTPFGRDQLRDAVLASDTGEQIQTVRTRIGETPITAVICHAEGGQTLCLNVQTGGVAQLTEQAQAELTAATVNGITSPSDLTGILEAVGRLDRPAIRRTLPSGGRWGRLSPANTLSHFSTPV